MPLGRMRLRGRRSHGDSKLHPLAIVAICLGVAVLLTLIVGNLLKIWMDDDLYNRLTGESETTLPPADPTPPVVRRVNAYLFALGDDEADAVGRTALSVPINASDGTMCYTSDLVTHFGLSVSADVALDEALAAAYETVPYISGVFYTRAFDYESADLRYAVAMQEAILLREFLYAGGSEIVIRGIPMESVTPDEVRTYIDVLRTATGKFHLGIALPWGLVKQETGWRLPAAFAGVADFCVLDLTAEILEENDRNDAGVSRSAEDLLAECRYYTTQYKLRILASDAQGGLITTMEILQVSDFQITRQEPVPETPAA